MLYTKWYIKQQREVYHFAAFNPICTSLPAETIRGDENQLERLSTETTSEVYLLCPSMAPSSTHHPSKEHLIWISSTKTILHFHSCN